MNIAFWIVAAWLALSSLAPVRIAVSRQTVMAGDSVTVTCTVRQDASNRELFFGIANYTASDRELYGDKANVTWPGTFYHVPCDAGPAFCLVQRADGGLLKATANLQVGGCE